MNTPGTGETMVHTKTFAEGATSWMFYIMILLVVSLPLSEFGMSVSQFLLFGIWIFEGADFSKRKIGYSLTKVLINNIAGKFRMLFSNYFLLAFLAVYIFLAIGLFYSSDLDYGLKDLRVKLPILTLPVLIGTSSSLGNKKFNLVLLFFSLSVIAATIISSIVYFTKPIGDSREISIFISHIRFGLFISFSIFILSGFLWFNTFRNKIVKLLIYAAIAWLFVFLFILKSFTGIAVTVIVSVVLLIISALKDRKVFIPLVLILLAIFIAGYSYLRSIYRELTIPKPLTALDYNARTQLGNKYIHDTIHFGVENGAYVGSYISFDELREEWNKRSNYDFDGMDKKNQELKYTLIRFLHSKGFKKDAEGVKRLSKEEVSEIENGVTNEHYIHGLSVRGFIEQTMMGYITYKADNNANASSLMQRIEYWKTSMYIINKNPYIGQGTGDVKNSFEKAYIDTHSTLLPEYRHRAHNQFLTITIALGIVGLVVFLFSLFYPPAALGKFYNYYYLVFFCIAVISFLTEDTLETQAGATFFGFFSALLLFGVRKEVDEKSHIN